MELARDCATTGLPRPEAGAVTGDCASSIRARMIRLIQTAARLPARCAMI